MNLIEIIPDCQNRSLIQHILQICTAEARRTLRQRIQIHILGKMLVACMNPENCLSALAIRKCDRDLTIKPASSEQCRIKDIRTVGSRNDDDTAVIFHTIHFNKQLIQGLFPFIMAASETSTSLSAYGINFVDEDNAWCSLLRFLEHVTHTARTDTDKHLDKVRTGNAVERYICLAGNCLGKQGLAGSRMTAQKHALRNPGTHLLELGRILEIIDDLCHLLLLFIAACNIRKPHLRLRLELCSGLAELKCLGICAVRTAHAVHHPYAHDDDQDQRNYRIHDFEECIAGIRIHNADLGILQLIQKLINLF